MTLLAGCLHIQPSEIDAMDVDDLTFWLERQKEWVTWQKEAQGDHSPSAW